MKTEIVEDKLVSEIPVYLSKSLLGQLHMFQYPVRPRTHTYDDENIIKAQIKPNSGQVEIEVGLQTRTQTFDRSKGEQIALNVDGAFRDKREAEDNYYTSNTMDKILLSSSKSITDTKRYAIGVLGEGSLHLLPITSVLTMKPSFEYLDMADKRSKHDHKEQSDESDDEDNSKRVTVRFERPETDRSKEMKEKSYMYLQRKIREESWIPLKHFKFGSERSEFESRHLYCSYQNEKVDHFTLDETKYLNQLVPPTTEGEINTAGLPANLLSMSALKTLPLQERLKTLIQNAKVASFSELVNSVSSGRTDDDPSSILKIIQQMAVLVQGNWVVKSDIIYPKEGSSESFVSNEVLQRARDCVLYLFTKQQLVNRLDVIKLISVPDRDLILIFHAISKCKPGRGWEFMLPTDNNFIRKYPDVSQRQQMIWQSRYEQLSQHFIKK